MRFSKFLFTRYADREFSFPSRQGWASIRQNASCAAGFAAVTNVGSARRIVWRLRRAHGALGRPRWGRQGRLHNCERGTFVDFRHAASLRRQPFGAALRTAVRPALFAAAIRMAALVTRARRAGPSPVGTARKIAKPLDWYFAALRRAASLRWPPDFGKGRAQTLPRPRAQRALAPGCLGASAEWPWQPQSGAFGVCFFVSRKTTRLVSGLRYTKMVSHAGKIYMRNHFYSMTYYSIPKLQEGTPVAEKGRFKYQPFKCRCTIV